MKTLIVIPARFGSTRLPGKPLVMIGGQSMLSRVVQLCQEAASGLKDVSIVVATDDRRIGEHCDLLGVEWQMTAKEARSGTDRVAEVVRSRADSDDFILNMQGDAPLTPPDFLRAMMDTFAEHPTDAVTPVVQLSWDELDTLRENKRTTPFSGTTAVFDVTGRALWFSKTIIPAIREEAALREASSMSPVFRHIGLYGFARKTLLEYVNLPESPYEKLEGLEQLRLLENCYTLRCVPVDYKGRPGMSGVDSPDDVQRAQALLQSASVRKENS
ncbi:3-deoxy-manno-octulosonate cytidylyltransferase [Legionella geestiana]|uniref:3-deoxy-manno-octulosonate cytidylyltransferase n=1 Tax=Legionella geestiana TaxID=45065 RepID=A0A0W0U7F2_9GAMM|nr:manno-octulosonate cytidylyltransferase [Legionella geestiana]KTD03966.1 3-deoxy-manno-octulosonate cytidylyltransferase [Legionella geestiana]QBS12970.1 3-deoxy-manno-octulosonate cytidylyltransferase [Legionella geestiana]STX54523.1 3-deoxy-manno-octulosonate cytidylyltransferase [Legionella geestiana]